MTSRPLASWLERVWRPGWHWWFAAIALSFVIFWLSSLPAEEIFSPGPRDGAPNVFLKKTAHVIAYGSLAISLVRGIQPYRFAVVAAFLLAVAYGATDEWHQSFVPGREATLRDFVFDVVGAATALLFHERWLQTNRAQVEPNESRLGSSQRR